MPSITQDTTFLEIAALVSEALVRSGITAVLSGGGAVSAYTENRYQSADLDFVTAAGLEEIEHALRPLGFTRRNVGRSRYFEHSECRWFVEFPPAPLAVGSKRIQSGEWAQLETQYGTIQILTPTQSVMDRLAAYFWWDDQQSFDQAVMIAESQTIKWPELEAWIEDEQSPKEKFERFKMQVTRNAAR